MRESENYFRIYEAIGKAKEKIPVMPKDCNGYGYKYTSLETISKTLKPILREAGIDYIQPLDEINGTGAITTRVFTLDGKDFVEFTTPLPVGEMAKMNNVQAMGATVTYFRRYAICSFLGIIADEDIDARSFEKEQNQKNDKPAKKTESPKDPEFLALCNEIDGYVTSGVLKGKGLEGAKWYIKNHDIEGMKRTVAWCENEMYKQ